MNTNFLDLRTVIASHTEAVSAAWPDGTLIPDDERAEIESITPRRLMSTSPVTVDFFRLGDRWGITYEDENDRTVAVWDDYDYAVAEYGQLIEIAEDVYG